MSKRSLATVLLVGAIAAGSGFLLARWQDGPTAHITASHESVARTAPRTQLPDVQGQLRSVSDWSGQVLVVNFWATWCAPCLEEIPMFIKVRNAYRQNRVEFIGIALDNRDRVMEFMQKTGMDYPVLLGGAEGIELGKQFGNKLGVLPFSAIVDRMGNVVHTQFGVFERDELEALIEQRL